MHTLLLVLSLFLYKKTENVSLVFILENLKEFLFKVPLDHKRKVGNIWEM